MSLTLPPIKSFLPFLNFWKGQKAFLADLAAGATVGMVLVPQAMAYAALAGMPPETGLYAGCFACMLGAAFGQCASVNTGPVAMTSLLCFAALAPLAEAGSNAYIQLAAILAMMVGVVRFIISFCKATFLVTLISQPVLTGFTAAAGITIASTQVPKFFNLDHLSENPVWNVALMITHVTDAHLPSLVMGVSTLIAMIAFKKALPKWPGLLMALIGATIISHLIDFSSMGGKTVGALPAGLPPFSLPSEGWSLIPELLPAALLVSIIGLLEVMTVTSSVEKKTKKPTDLNKEMLGQGMASLCAGVTGGFPVSGSLSRSSLNLLAGAQTGLSSVFSGLVVLLTLIWLTPLLEPMPYPALAAAILMAVSTLIKPQVLIHTWKLRKSDAMFGLATLVITLVMAPNMVIGMAFGIGLSVGWFLLKVMNPRIILLAKGTDTRWAAAKQQDDITMATKEGAVVIRADVRMNFLNAVKIMNRVKSLMRPQPDGTDCIFCASSINDIDFTGCEALCELSTFLESKKGRLLLADVKAPVRMILNAHPQLKKLEVYPSIDLALKETKQQG